MMRFLISGGFLLISKPEVDFSNYLLYPLMSGNLMFNGYIGTLCIKLV